MFIKYPSFVCEYILIPRTICHISPPNYPFYNSTFRGSLPPSRTSHIARPPYYIHHVDRLIFAKCNFRAHRSHATHNIYTCRRRLTRTYVNLYVFVPYDNPSHDVVRSARHRHHLSLVSLSMYVRSIFCRGNNIII